MLLSLILYGSRARGDHRLNSDVDLLGVTETGSIDSEIAVRGASFYAYPSKTLIENSKNGDLFVSHLVHEGKVLHDTVDFFESVKTAFVYKENYTDEIKVAHAILCYLRGRPTIISRKSVRKRLVWAIRTILISRAAERGIAAFSARDLSDFANCPNLKSAIDKRNVIDSKILFSVAEQVADEFGSQEIHTDFPAEKQAQDEFLRKLGGIAISTLEISTPVKFKFSRPKPLVVSIAHDYE